MAWTRLDALEATTPQLTQLPPQRVCVSCVCVCVAVTFRVRGIGARVQREPCKDMAVLGPGFRPRVCHLLDAGLCAKFSAVKLGVYTR